LVDLLRRLPGVFSSRLFSLLWFQLALGLSTHLEANFWHPL
jgi:hypothetical protein